MHPNVRAAVAAVLLIFLLAGAGCTPKPAPEKEKPDTAQEAAGTVHGTTGVIHVDDGGAGGIPVVFVHAFAGNTTHWAGTLAHLRTTRRAIAFDLRGHGQTPAPAWSGGYAVDSLASDIDAVVGQLGLGRIVLVGHSMGGAAAAAYAGMHPERLAGLVLVGAPGPSPPAIGQKIVAQIEANYDSTMGAYWELLLKGGTPETQARIREERASLGREPSIEISRAIFAYDPRSAIRAFPGPILLIDTPEGDNPMSIHRLAPKLERKVMTTSHWPMLDKPEEFDAILDAFLAEVTKAEAAKPDSAALVDTI